MNPSLLWLGAALLTWGIGEGMFYMFQPIYLQQLGADPIQIGMILGALGFVMTLAHIPAGYLSDRIGRRPILIAAWGIGVVAALIMAMATDLSGFVVGALLYGFTAFVISPLESYVTATRGSWSVGRAITFISLTFNIGAVLGPIVGGWVGDQSGLRMVYWLAVGVFSISAISVWFIAPQSHNHPSLENRPDGLLTNWRYLGFLSIFLLVVFATYLPQPLTPNFLRDQHELSLSAIGALGSISSLGNVALNFGLGRQEARTGFLLGQVSVALFTILLWRGVGFEWFALGYFMLGGFRALRALGIAQVQPFVHESQMGLAYGIAETVGSATVLLGPPFAGFLYTRDPALMYPVALGLIAIGFCVSLVLLPRFKYRQENQARS